MGSDRISDNPLWICCCCGCLPWIALIKIAFISPICTIIIVPSCTLISIILLPHDIIYTYYTVLATKKYGPNLKILGVLLIWAPLIAWPIMVLIASTFFGIGLGVYWAFSATFDTEYNILWGGIWSGWSNAAECVIEFWKFNYNSYFSYLADIREPLSDGQVPFDIRIIDIIIGLFICLIGIIIDFPVMTILSVIYLVPCIFKGYYFWFKTFWKTLQSDGCIWIFACFPFVIVSFVLVPVAVVLICLGVCVWGIFCGPRAAVEAYNNGPPAAFKKMFFWIKEINKKYMEALCEWD